MMYPVVPVSAAAGPARAKSPATATAAPAEPAMSLRMCSSILSLRPRSSGAEVNDRWEREHAASDDQPVWRWEVGRAVGGQRVPRSNDASPARATTDA